MCGRFVRANPNRRMMSDLFGVQELPELPLQYNIAPTDPVLIVRATSEGPREAAVVRWGLIPFWAKDAKIGAKMINARAESLETAPAFRKAVERRCLLPADGFYEWAEKKKPYFIHGASTLAFAGLWAKWKAPSGETVHSCTIVTVDACPLVRPIHDRMPLIVAPEHHGVWLDRGVPIALALPAVLARPLDASLAMHAVTPEVGRVGFDEPRAIEPLRAGPSA